MSKYLIQNTTLENIADEVRTLSGMEETMTPSKMKENLNGANSAIQTEADLIAQILAALNSKVNKTFTFYIKGEPHTAERGMTWKEWCASDYCDNWYIFSPEDPYESWVSNADDHIYYDGEYIRAINIIVPERDYVTIFNPTTEW